MLIKESDSDWPINRRWAAINRPLRGGPWYFVNMHKSGPYAFLKVHPTFPNRTASPSFRGMGLSGSRRCPLRNVPLVLFRSVSVELLSVHVKAACIRETVCDSGRL